MRRILAVTLILIMLLAVLTGCMAEDITGTITFYSEATSEKNEPVSDTSFELSKEQVKAIKKIIKNIKDWTDDCVVDRLPLYFDGEIKFSDSEFVYYFSYDSQVIYYDHYFAVISDDEMQKIKDIRNGKEGEQNPSGKRLPIVMTIAETLPSCVAFEYKDGKPYCFYAYDIEGHLYRVLWNDFTSLNEKDVVVVDHNDDIKKLDQVNPPGGWTPQYEVTAISIQSNEMASCVSDEDGTYYLILPQSKDKIKIRDEQRLFVPYISDSLVESAEKKIANDISKYNNNSGFYLQVTEEYLCLTVEVIKQLDEPDENVGCIDHEHLFFSERITLCPVYTQGSENNNSVISKYASKRVWDRNHPDDSERDPHFSITVPELGDAAIEYKEDGKVYVDGEILFGGSGNGCESFYLADIDGDGHPELCFGTNLGSGIVHLSVAIYDYDTKGIIFTLSDRMHYDYYFFLRDGQLCVKETEYMQQETVRTGTVSYDGSQITVSWDKEVNDNADRDKIPEPAQPVS